MYVCAIFFLVCVICFLLLFYVKKIIMYCTVNTKFKNCIENMVDYEKEIVNFYKGSPKKGYYVNYLKKIEKEAGNFLKQEIFKNLIGKTVVMDIDDTLVWTGKSHKNGLYEGIPPMVRLAKLVKRLGYNLIIITARAPFMLEKSIENLNMLGVYPDKVFTSLWFGQDQSFKAVMRKKLENNTLRNIQKMNSEDLFNDTNKYWNPFNIKVVMTIGDRWCDVINQNDVLGIKLPEPSDMNGYLVYNNEVKIF